MASTATHFSNKVSMEHNMRLRPFIENELKKELETKGTQHIDMDGVHEIWAHEDPRALYTRVFGRAVEEYNKAQKRKDRRIEDYYDKIKSYDKMNPVYEVIVGVYGSDVPPEVGYAIVKEYADGWNERNPNMEIAGMYWHQDEIGLNGHLHLDFVPRADEFGKDPRTWASYTQALKCMGYEDTKRQTAQTQWQLKEKEVLESICRAHGIEPQREAEKRAHQEKEAYIAEKRLREAKEGIQQFDPELIMQDVAVKQAGVFRKQEVVEIPKDDYIKMMQYMALESSLAARMAELERKEAEYKAREKEMVKRQYKTREKANEIADREADIANREKGLVSKEREIQERLDRASDIEANAQQRIMDGIRTSTRALQEAKVALEEQLNQALNDKEQYEQWWDIASQATLDGTISLEDMILELAEKQMLDPNLDIQKETNRMVRNIFPNPTTLKFMKSDFLKSQYMINGHLPLCLGGDKRYDQERERKQNQSQKPGGDNR